MSTGCPGDFCKHNLDCTRFSEIDNNLTYNSIISPRGPESRFAMHVMSVMFWLEQSSNRPVAEEGERSSWHVTGLAQANAM